MARIGGRKLGAALAVMLGVGGVAVAGAPPAAAAPTPGLVYQLKTDGTPTFDATAGPGNDTGANNGITRNQDVVSILWGINVNGESADTAVVTQTLPVGMVWDLGSAPSACLSVTYSDSNRTITCNLGAITAGTAFDMTATARVSGSNPDGTTLVMPAPTFTVGNSTGSTTAPTSPSIQTISSGRPKLDLRKDLSQWSQIAAKGADGVTPGIVMFYPISLEVVGGGKGSEALMPGQDIKIIDTPVTYLRGTGLAATGGGTPNPLQNGTLYTWGTGTWGSSTPQDGCYYNGEPATPNGVHFYWNMPYGRQNLYEALGYGPVASNPTHHVGDPGTWNCQQPGGPGTPISLTISGSDTTGDNRPKYAGYPFADYALPADTTFINAGMIAVWFPVTDFPTTGQYAYQLDVRNRVEFGDHDPLTAGVQAPLSLSGTPNIEPHNPSPAPGQNAGPNVGDTWYTTNDNARIHSMVGYAGGFDKWYTAGESVGDGFRYYVPGSSARTGDAFVGPGQDFSARVWRSNGGFLTQSNTVCDVFDNTWQEIKPIVGTFGSRPSGTQGAFLELGNWTRSALPAGRAFTIQYSTKGFTDIQSMRESTCTDADGPWYNNLDLVPGGAAAVTRVRATFDLEGGEAINLVVSFKAKATAPNDALLVNFGTFKDQYSTSTYPTTDGWYRPDYTPANDGTGNTITGKPWNALGYVSTPSLPLASGGGGDRIRIARAQTRITKKTVNGTTADDSINSVRAGNPVTYELAPTFTSYLPVPPVAEHVYIYDVLDRWVTYVSGSSVATPNSPAVAQPTVINTTDPVSGAPITVLKWDLGMRTAGTPLPTIRYTVRTKTNAAGGTVTGNSVVVDAVDATGASLDTAGCLSATSFTVAGSGELGWLLPSSTQVAQSADTSCPRGWSRNVTINQVSSLTIGKEVVETAIERDGTLTYRVTYANVQDNPILTTIEVVDVLPEAGDGRSPANTWVGTATLAPNSLSVVEKVGGGTATIRYTNAPKATVRSIYETDPANPLPITTVSWCLETEFGTAGCPAGWDDVTGWRVSEPGPLYKGEFGVIQFQLVTKDNVDGNVYTNRATGKAAEVSLPVASSDVSTPVVGGSISNLVWVDSNGNGKQDAGEVGLPNTTVRLFESDGTTPIQVWSAAGTDGIRGTNDDVYVDYVTTTGSDGSYIFSNLVSGDYTVQFTPPSGYEGTEPRVGSVAGIDSNPDRLGLTNDYLTPTISLACRDASGAVLPTCDPLVLANVDDDPTVDAGFFQKVSIGNYVWEDTNGDGVQGAAATEPPVAGATVTLWRDADGDPTTTDWVQVTEDVYGNALPDGGVDTTGADGLYLFSDLPPGIYQTRFEAPSGYVLTAPVQGTDPAVDSNPVPNTGSPATGSSAGVLVPSGANNTTLDAGVYQPATIGNIVWNDVDGDGVQDSTEVGIEGAKATLWKDTDPGPGSTWVQVTQDLFGNTFGTSGTITTPASGEYLFEDVAPGTYQVRFEAPAGKSFTQPNTGVTTDALDSDAVATSSTTAATGSYDLSSGEEELTVDAGVTEPSGLGDTVWVDTDGNGQQDPSETGIGGATVEIERKDPVTGLWTSTFVGIDGQPYTTTTTSAATTGYYEFIGLVPGTYRVKFTPPTGYVLTAADKGADGTDSDANRTTGYSAETTIDPGEFDSTIDAGVSEPVSVGDFVWLDTDGDGVQDATETGIEGVLVELIDADGNVFGTDTTDEDGAWLIDNVGSDQDSATAALLPAGNYTVRFTRPDGLAPSPATGAPDGAADDSDALFASASATTGTTSTFNLASGEDETKVDAGFYAPASIGDLVWLDNDGDGLKDAAETGVAGAKVTLWQDTDPGPGETWVQVTADIYGNTFGTAGTITTPPSGAYLFDDLAPGTYQVRFETPAGYVLTAPNQGSDDTADSDAVFTTGAPTLGSAAPVTLASGDAVTHVDAGIYMPANIGDQVWHDRDGDGVNEPTALVAEEPLEGHLVTLWRDTDPGAGVTWTQVTTDVYGNTFGTAGVVTTDDGGNYDFSDIAPGDYQVRFESTDADLKFTYPNSTLDGGTDVTDSDALPLTATTASTATVTLDSGETDNTVDAGLTDPPGLGDTIWLDTDADGVQDEGEPGIEGVTVAIEQWDASSETWKTSFLNNDGDPYPTTTTTTDTGFYQFVALPPGTYRVKVTAPDGYLVSPQDAAAATDATDSDIDRETGYSQSVTLLSGDYNETIDAGLYQPVIIGDKVWNDLDADGIQDAGEPGIAAVVVVLFDANLRIVASTITDSSGNWSIDRLGNDQDAPSTMLDPGDYIVRFGAPLGWNPSDLDGGSDTVADDSDPVFESIGHSTARTALITLSSGENEPDVDAGFFAPASIGDNVWLDTDGNGQQDSTETGIAGAKVTLWQDTDPGPGETWVQVTADIYGDPLGTGGTITTDATGAYLFTNLRPGTYQVRFEAPAGHVLTAANVGADGTDSDAVRTAPTTGSAAPVTLQSGDAVTTVDAGVYMPASIGNFVWEDSNRDGIQDAAEVGVANIIVQLTGTDGAGNPVSLMTTTASDGSYTFANLAPGTYTVAIAPPEGFVPTLQNVETAGDATDSDTSITDTDPTAGQSFPATPTTLVSGENDTTWDAGLVRNPSLSGYVYVDADNDGIRDSGEAGIKDVTITLTGKDSEGNDVSLTTTTDATGFYSFPNLLPSDAAGYTVTETHPATYLDGKDTAGSTGGVTTTNEKISNIVLESSDVSVLNNFGEVLPASLSGKVYVDNTNDGIAQAGEPPIGGVPVTLTGTDDLGNPVTATTTTDPDGTYSFTGLRPGTYTVTETQPSAYGDGKDTAGSTGGSTSTNDAITAIPLASGQNSVNNNFGELPATSGPLTRVEGNVWLDPNRDGIRQPGENTGIEGVTITLKTADGTVVATTTTDSNGHYSFEGIAPGDYIIEETQPSDYLTTSPNTLGSAGTPISVPLAGLTNQDFFEALGSLSGFVYVDTTDSGTRTAGEPGIGGVVVQLIEGEGNVIATTTTGADGSYRFDNLKPGTYSVREIQPLAWVDDLDTAGDKGGTAADDLIVGAVLAAGDNGIDYNFGEQPAPTDPGKTWVSGHVYLDANVDNDLNNGEDGLAGVTVELWKDGTKIAETTTGADGSYIFNNIDPGTYVIKEIQPAGYGSTEQPTNEITAIVPTVGLPNQDFGETLPPGVATPAFVSGAVWVDSDGDGIIDAGEQGVEGVLITLKDADGNVVATTTTGPGGTYEFTNLVPGTYTIEETQPTGYADSPGTPATVRSSITVPAEGLTNQNFGEQLASVSGYVYQDTNNDGVKDVGELPIGNVTITLTGKDINGNTVTLTTMTDASGRYEFTDLLPSDDDGYTITQTQPVGYTDGLDSAGNLGGTASNDVTTAVVVGAGENGVDYNFGEVPYTPPTNPGTVWVGGVVYFDADRDGTIDPGDTPMAGVDVYIKDSTGTVIGTTTTGPDGSYYFTGLTPGSQYTVVQNQPVGYGSSEAAANEIPVTAPTTGGTNGLDFGETLSTVSGVVWKDLNNDGIKQPNEDGIGGVVVTLTGTAADGSLVEMTATTDATGAYVFEDLKSGTYTVTETQPVGYTDGKEAFTGSSSAPTTTNDKHASIVVPTGVDRSGYDFGEVPPPPFTTFVSGTVFRDKLGEGTAPNGTLDAGETGIGGVTIVLKDSTGAVVATTVTLADGTYRFDGIVPGDYTVEEVQPSGLASSSPNSVPVTVPVEGKSNVNFGEYLTFISGTVYVDRGADGVTRNQAFDAGEPTLAGVTITLKDTAGNVIATTTTDASGAYRFDDVLPGNYTVEESQPSGYGSSTPNTLSVTAPAQGLPNVNFGETLGSVNGNVWGDLDKDGTRDSNEPGIPGVVVTLTGSDVNGNVITRTVTTDDNGNYVFGDLPPSGPDGYTVTQTQPVGWNDGSDVAFGGTLGNDTVGNVRVGVGGDVTAANFGEVRPSLPVTGSDPHNVLFGGAAALVLGALAMMFARRRRMVV